MRLKYAKDRDVEFEFDPEKRAAQAAQVAQSKNIGRIRLMKGCKRRRVEAGALGADEAPGTPPPQSPKLFCPGHADMNE